jgi:hypothetical protein
MMDMKLTKDEQKESDEFMENPFYREIVENAPNEKCRDYIIHGLIYGLYGGFDPEICKDSLEDGLTADDWRYVKRNLAGNNPYLLKCVTRIKELSVA